MEREKLRARRGGPIADSHGAAGGTEDGGGLEGSPCFWVAAVRGCLERELREVHREF